MRRNVLCTSLQTALFQKAYHENVHKIEPGGGGFTCFGTPKHVTPPPRPVLGTNGPIGRSPQGSPIGATLGHFGGPGGLLGHVNRDSCGPAAPRSPQGCPLGSTLGHFGGSTSQRTLHQLSGLSRHLNFFPHSSWFLTPLICTPALLPLPPVPLDFPGPEDVEVSTLGEAPQPNACLQRHQPLCGIHFSSLTATSPPPATRLGSPKVHSRKSAASEGYSCTLVSVT